MENLANDIETTLNGAIDDAVTAITVTSGTGFPAANFRIRIEDELMLVTSVGGGTDWTVTREVEGTTAAAHADGVAVVHVLSKGGLDQYVTERYQPLDADLTAIAALAKTDGNIIVGDGSTWVAESGATARASLGLGTIATQAADNVNIDGGTIDGATIGGSTPGAGTFTNLSSTGTTTLGDASGDTLTINAGTWTIGANYTATRAAGTVAAGVVTVLGEAVTFTGDAGETSNVRPWTVTAQAQGANNFAAAYNQSHIFSHNSSGTVALLNGVSNFISLISTGGITTGTAFASQYSLTTAANVTNARHYTANAAQLTSTGTITTHVGFLSGDLGHATLVTNAIGHDASDMTAAATLTAGFRSNITSGTGKWGFYAAGTANNAFAGNVRIGSVVAPTVALDVTGAITSSTIITAGTSVMPDANDGAVLGSATVSWSDLFLASGAVINFANGNAVLTHSSAVLTVSTGDLRVTTAGTNSASVVTVGGTQTLTNKTLTDPTISSAHHTSFSGAPISTLVSGSTTGALIQSPSSAHIVIGIRDNDAGDSFAIVSGGGNYTTDTTYDTLVAQFRANGSVFMNAGTVQMTTVDINGGAIDGTIIGAASAAAGTFTTIVAGTSILPDANDGAVLGSATVSWSDLFLASGAVINWNNGDVTLTHAANTIIIAGGSLRIPDGTAGAPGLGVTTDSTTGLFSSNDNTLRVSCAGTQVASFQPAGSGGLAVATSMTVGATTTNQSGSYVASRRGGNSFEFGHTNTAGYGSTLGAESGAGVAFLAFYSEHGTNANTYRTRGNRGTVLRAATNGGIHVSDITNTSADNQSPTMLLQLGPAGTGGIQFPATQIPSSDANTLDDYEEGTWTPTLTYSSGTITSYTASGQYTKIGRICHINANITVTTKGTASGVPSVGSQPFTFDGTAGQVGVGRNANITGQLLQWVNAGFFLESDNADPVTVDGTALYLTGVFR